MNFRKERVRREDIRFLSESRNVLSRLDFYESRYWHRRVFSGVEDLFYFSFSRTCGKREMKGMVEGMEGK